VKEKSGLSINSRKRYKRDVEKSINGKIRWGEEANEHA